MHKRPIAASGAEVILPASLRSVERALAELRRGAMVIMRGPAAASFVLAAEGISHESLIRLRALAAGAPELAITGRRAQNLGYGDGAADALRITLPGGVSATDVRMMADPLTTPTDSPPQPLALHDIPPEGIEAGAVEMLKLARLLPAAVIAYAPAGRLDYLSAWAQSEDLLIVELSDVLIYREAEARGLKLVAEAKVPLTEAAETRIYAFRPTDGGREHLAVVIGDPAPGDAALVRLHSECFTGDLLGSLRCDCGDQLHGAIAEIAKNGSGILLYLAQEGRGIGLVNKLRAYSLQDQGFDTIDANEQLGFDADERFYLPAAEMLRQLGYAKVRLMTNNPEKIAALHGWGIEVVERVPHSFPSNKHNEQYLATKQDRAGHLLG